MDDCSVLEILVEAFYELVDVLWLTGKDEVVNDLPT